MIVQPRDDLYGRFGFVPRQLFRGFNRARIANREALADDESAVVANVISSLCSRIVCFFLK